MNTANPIMQVNITNFFHKSNLNSRTTHALMHNMFDWKVCKKKNISHNLKNIDGARKLAYALKYLNGILCIYHLSSFLIYNTTRLKIQHFPFNYPSYIEFTARSAIEDKPQHRMAIYFFRANNMRKPDRNRSKHKFTIASLKRRT